MDFHNVQDVGLQRSEAMNVLFIDPSWEMQDWNILKKVGGYTPHLGMLYMASFLLKHNHDVQYYDCTAEKIKPSEFDTSLFVKPDFICLTSTTPLYPGVLILSKKCKSAWPDCKIIIGGCHPSALPDDCLKEKVIDYVCRGEGEETLLELIEGMELSTIENLSYKEDGKIINNKRRMRFIRLDDLPMPAYHLIDFKKYKLPVGSYKRLPGATMFAGRGCTGQCKFCSSKLIFPYCRFRSARNIADEIRVLKGFGMKEIHFYDDAFTTWKDLVMELCQILINENFDITWSCFARADAVDEEMLREMKSAGCHLILFGVESADPQILKNINKELDLSKVKVAIDLCKNVGIEVRPSFMLGNPGETEETMKKTIDFAISLDPDFAQFSIATAYPGTELWNWAEEKGYLIRHPWEDYYVNKLTLNLPSVNKDVVKKFHALAYRKFYFRFKIILRLLFRVRNWPQFSQLFKGGLALLSFKTQ